MASFNLTQFRTKNPIPNLALNRSRTDLTRRTRLGFRVVAAGEAQAEPDLSVTVNGLHMPNPFVIGSGPPGTNYTVMKRAFDEGWGAVIAKTVSLDAAKVINVTPRYARLRADSNGSAKGQIIGWENIELISDRPLETMLKEFKQLKEEYPDRILIASIMEEYNKAAWEELIDRVEQTGVDAFEINFSCPHGMPERRMGAAVGQDCALLEEVCGWINAKATIPVWAKMTPNITDISQPARVALKSGCEGIAAINTIMSVMGIDLKTLRPEPCVEGYSTPGGYSSKAVHPIALGKVLSIAKMMKAEFNDGDYSLSGIGGVETGGDAAEFILLGANTVQVCTGVMMHGYGLVKKLCAELKDFMKLHNFSSIEDFRGASLPYFTTHTDLVRRQREAIEQRKAVKKGLQSDKDWTGIWRGDELSMSSPEASSSSEDEFDLNAPAVSKEESGAAKPQATADNSKLFSDDEDDENDSAANGSAVESADKGGASSSKKAKADGGSSDEDRDKEKEMEDLFGSDYDSEEEEFKASGIKESPVREENRHVAQDQYAEDHGVSYGSHSNEVWLPKTPKAPKSAQYFICKMPNILRLVPEAYTKQAIDEEMRNPSDEMLYRNYVRWRYQRDENGRVKLDPKTKKPLRESNAKLVQWEDGSLTMFVGKEALSLSRQKIPNSFLFATEVSSDKPEADEDPDAPGQETVLECHGRLKEKLTIRPTTTSSKSHKSLTMSMRAKHNKGVQKIKHYISELDGEREQEQRAKINDDRLRLQNRKKARQTYEYDRERSSRMDASFLEEGYDGVEYDDDDVGAIKHQFGAKSKGAAARRPAPPARRPSASSFRGDGFDEYSRNRAREAERSDSEQEQAEEEQDDDDDDEDIVVRSVKKRRTVDEDDSD